ncbi:MAG: translation initiation factor IF-2 N-terminal domain-containing protein, partial [Coriobacteriales bacterium]
MRVHELAKEFGLSSKEMLDKLAEMKIPAKNHASTLVDAYVDKVRKQLGPEMAERAARIEREAQEAAAAEAAKAEAERQRIQEEQRLAAEEERRRRQEEKARRDAELAEKKRLAEEAKEAEREAKRLKPTSVFDGLLSQIAAENDRLANEKAEAATAKREKEEAKEAAHRERGERAAERGEGHDGRERNNKKKKKGGRKAEVSVDDQSEDDRYRQMAVAAEQLQRDKVLEEARAAVAEAETESKGRRKKRKERRAAEAAKKAEEEAIKEAERTGIAVGVIKVVSGVTVGELAELLEVPGNEIVKRLFLLGTPLTLTQTMSDELVELIAD